MTDLHFYIILHNQWIVFYFPTILLINVGKEMYFALSPLYWRMATLVSTSGFAFVKK